MQRRRAPIAGTRFLSALPILAYHHVGPARPSTLPWLTVPASLFEAQIIRLRDGGWQTIGCREAAAWILEGRPLPAKAVMLTFDDAYADLENAALPMLERVGFGATVFVPTAYMGGRNAWEPPEAQGHRLLDPQSIRRWSGRGIEFGAHTRHHVDLRVVDGATLEDEVLGGKRDLEDLLQAPVLGFAYPYGASGPESAAAVASAFRLAFTLDEGLNRAGQDPHHLRRTMMQTVDTPLDLLLRLRLGRSPVRLARQRLGVARRRLRSQLSSSRA